jgi:hypothetical protein
MEPASLSGFRRPEESPYGSVLRPIAAQEVAMLEAGRPVLASDPQVATAAFLLSALTAVYVEDAPRIATLTVRTVRRIRAANQPASPLEMLAGAVQWTGPSGPRGNLPRKFEEFAGLYLKQRTEGQDHSSALARMQPAVPSGPRAPVAVP